MKNITINKFSFNSLLLIITITLGVLLFFSIRGCNTQRDYSGALIKLANYKDTVKTYKSKQGKLVEYNDALKVDIKSFKAIKDSLTKYIESIDIPEPDVIVQTKTLTKIDSIPVIKFITKDGKIDTTFNIENKYYSIAGNINNTRTNSLKIDSIKVFDKSTIVVGDRREDWWKKKEYIITVEHSNKYIKNTGMKACTIEDPQSRWSLSLSLGYGGYLDFTKGSMGHGITVGPNISYTILNL